ncbi:MAG: hypothetical protein V3U03_00185, partial [Myxococcota bacterium]
RPEDEDVVAHASQAMQGYWAGLEENPALAELMRGVASAGRSVWSRLFGDAPGGPEPAGDGEAPPEPGSDSAAGA